MIVINFNGKLSKTFILFLIAFFFNYQRKAIKNNIRQNLNIVFVLTTPHKEIRLN